LATAVRERPILRAISAFDNRALPAK